MIRRLRLGSVLSLPIIVLVLGLIKLLLMFNLPLPFLMTEANQTNGFLIILLVITPAQFY
jgi:hypothetical protein